MMKSFRQERNFKESKTTRFEVASTAAPAIEHFIPALKLALPSPHLNGFKKKSDSQLST
jgi:hypothetical protein